MKRLKTKQIGAWCSYCPEKTVRAVYRQDGFCGKFCCEENKQELQKHEEQIREADSHMTEADYQTWGRL